MTAAYAEAKKALLAICADLESQGDHSAANSLREGLEDTLHRLRVGKELRQQLRTTNRTEHVNSRIKHDVRRIKRWNNSNQTQRWTVMAVLDAERRRNRIVYQDQLDALKQALWEHVSSSQNTTETEQKYLAKDRQKLYHARSSRENCEKPQKRISIMEPSERSIWMVDRAMFNLRRVYNNLVWIWGIQTVCFTSFILLFLVQQPHIDYSFWILLLCEFVLVFSVMTVFSFRPEVILRFSFKLCQLDRNTYPYLEEQMKKVIWAIQGRHIKSNPNLLQSGPKPG